jgi:hypothetical protein
MAEKIESTDRLSNQDREMLERKVDITVDRDVTTMSPKVPEEVAFKDEATPADRTRALISQYDDYLAEIDKLLTAIGLRCKGLIYRVEAETEYDCAAAIEALFEGEKSTISYDDYKKILELEAALSRDLVAQGGVN